MMAGTTRTVGFSSPYPIVMARNLKPVKKTIIQAGATTGRAFGKRSEEKSYQSLSVLCGLPSVRAFDRTHAEGSGTVTARDNDNFL
jgi:hypothetical protein